MNTETTQISQIPTGAPLALEPNAARPRDYAPRRDKAPSRRTIWTIGIACLIVGVAIGAAVMIHRQHTKDAFFAVNGDVITKDDLFTAMQNVAGTEIMQQLVNDRLQVQYAKSLGVEPTAAQVAERLQQLESEPNFGILLEQTRMTAPQFAASLPMLMCKEAIFSKGVTVSDAEVQEYYNEESSPSNPHALFYRPPVITLQTIGSDTLQDSQAALDKLSSGMPFDLVAERYSVDDSRINGGHVSPITFGVSPLHQFPAVEQQLFNLQVGQQIGPLSFGRRFWLFRCLESSPALVIPLSAVEDQARVGALAEKGTRLNGQSISQQTTLFARSADLQAFYPRYKALATAN